VSRIFILLGLLAAGCSSVGAKLPAGFDQRTSPETAFLSFQAAVAQEDHDREFEYLSSEMRRRFGVKARTDWKDARATVLTQGHIAIKGILRAKIQDKPVRLKDGRVKLKVGASVAVVVKVGGTVWMRPQAILRVKVKGDSRERIYLDLGTLAIAPGPGMLAVMVPEDWQELLGEELSGEEVTMVQAQVEWFVDDFAMGDGQTAEDAAKEVEQKRKK